MATSPEDRVALRVLPKHEDLEQARNALLSTLPEQGLGVEETVQHLRKDITKGFNLASISPNYYGFVTGGVTEAAGIADNIVTEYDQNVQVHLPRETVATDVEDTALKLLCDLVGFDPNDWPHRIFTTGATAGNILGLACGREAVVACAARRQPGNSGQGSVGEIGIFEALRQSGLDDIQVLTTVPHSSLSKAASIVGLGRACVKLVGQEDAPHRFDMDRLRQCLDTPRTGSIVVISCGEVNTGRFATDGYEDLERLKELCEKHGAWLHVDAAFGLLARALSSSEFEAISRKGDGLELADSIAGDAHKLLNVPYDCGFFFSAELHLAERVFRNSNAAYLQSGSMKTSSIVSPLNLGLENSRRFRALPVYASLAAYGREGYRDMLERQIRLARAIAQFIMDRPEYVLLPESRLTRSQRLEEIYIVVLFRAKDDALNTELVRRINDASKIYVSGTVWAGAAACRFAVASWKVDVERDLQRIKEALVETVSKFEADVVSSKS